MKKLYTLIALLVSFIVFTATAQNNLPKEGPGFYFNNFQHYKDKNVDSALYYARLLAANENYLPTLEDLLHDSYAQAFLKRLPEQFNDDQKEAFKQMVASARKLLPAMLADTNAVLKKTVQPIYYWTQVQQNINDDSRVRELVGEFMKTQLSTTDMDENRVARYALLIHQEIAQKKSLEPTAKELLTPVKAYLKRL
jgi:hypothetical protein